jgi:hypothetical protein
MIQLMKTPPTANSASFKCRFPGLLAAGLCFAFCAQAQFVGIGTNTPTAPLSFQSVLGKKIVLHGDGNAAHTGIGVQSGFLQFYLGEQSAKMHFNQWGLFGVPSMTVTGAGQLGINMANPEDKLHIGGNLRLRWGSSLADAPGIWMANGTPATDPYFVGLVSNSDIGIYHAGPNPGYKMYWNITYGSMGINGDVGAKGFQLTSGGAGAATAWKMPQYYTDFTNLSREVFENTGYAIIANNVWQQLPGLRITQTYSKPTKVAVHFNVFARAPVCCAHVEFMVVVDLNGGGQKQFRYYIENGTVNTFHGTMMLDIPPGNHTVSIAVLKLNGADLELPAIQGVPSSLILQAMPGY